MPPELQDPPVSEIDPLAKLFGDLTEPEVIPPKEPPEGGKPPAKGKDVQVAEIRRAKDKAEAEAAELKKELEKTKEFTVLAPVAEYLKKKAGKLDEEVVNKFISDGKERKTKLTDYEKKLLEKEKLLEEISVDHSQDFQEGFVKPLRQEQGNLIAIIANIDNEKKIKHPDLVNSFFQQLTQVNEKTGEPLDSLSIKKLMVAFESEYKKKTGEDYEMPELKEVVNQVRSVTSKAKALVDSKRNWSQVKEERDKERLFDQTKKQEALVKRELENRKYIANKVIEEYDFTVIEDIIPRDEFAEGINENNTFLNEVLTKSKKKEYKDLLVDMTKAKFFDKMVESMKTLKEELATEKKKNKSSLPSGGPLPKTPVEKKKEANYNPLAYLDT